MSDEAKICANIEELTKLLNEHLRDAHEIGLKVHLGGSVGPLFCTGPPELHVHVWRETTLVRLPRYKTGKNGPELPSKTTTEVKE